MDGILIFILSCMKEFQVFPHHLPLAPLGQLQLAVFAIQTMVREHVHNGSFLVIHAWHIVIPPKIR